MLVVPEVEKPWQDSGNGRKDLVRAERKGHDGVGTSVGTRVLLQASVGGGQNRSGAAQLPLDWFRARARQPIRKGSLVGCSIVWMHQGCRSDP